MANRKGYFALYTGCYIMDYVNTYVPPHVGLVRASITRPARLAE